MEKRRRLVHLTKQIRFHRTGNIVRNNEKKWIRRQTHSHYGDGSQYDDDNKWYDSLTVRAMPTVAANDANLNSFVWYRTMNDVFPTPESPNNMTCNIETYFYGCAWLRIFLLASQINKRVENSSNHYCLMSVCTNCLVSSVIFSSCYFTFFFHMLFMPYFINIICADWMAVAATF